MFSALVKIVLAISFIGFNFVFAAGQTENPAEFTDKVLLRLKLDESTPEDAIKLLGTPQADEMDEFDLGGKNGLFQTSIKRFFQTKGGQKVFRKLIYKKHGMTDDLTLRFFEGKLVHIIFDYDLGKKSGGITAADLSEKYKIDFVILQGVNKDSKLSDFEGQKESNVPKVYDVLYTLLSVQKDDIYFVRMEYNNQKAFWRSITKKTTKELFPGFVAEMHLISRSLEIK